MWAVCLTCPLMIPAIKLTFRLATDLVNERSPPLEGCVTIGLTMNALWLCRRMSRFLLISE